MAPNSKGVCTPLSKKIKSRLNLTIAKIPNTLVRPKKNLFAENPNVVELKKGNPVLNKKFDILNVHVTGFRKYMPPYKAPPPIRRDFNLTNLNEIQTKFRFELNGTFNSKGDEFRDELYKTAKNLFLVGWIRCRSFYAMGHFQGDLYGISYMKKWLKQKYVKGGEIHNVNFSEENYGITTKDYVGITKVNDYRNPSKKKMHALQALEKIKREKLIEESRISQHELDQFYEENCVKNY